MNLFDKIMLTIFILSASVCLYCFVQVESSRMPVENSAPAVSVIIVPEEIPSGPEIKPVPEIPIIRTSSYVNLTFEEMDLLQQIAMCEARGEDAKGQALVMRVVINRSRKTGKSIYDTIYSRGQFSTNDMGTYIPNENNNEAIGLITDGWDESEGALYFCNYGYNGKEPLFKYGNHYFSK